MFNNLSQISSQTIGILMLIVLAPEFFLYIFLTSWGFIAIALMGILGFIAKKYIHKKNIFPWIIGINSIIGIGYGYYWQWMGMEDARRYPDEPCKIFCGDPVLDFVISLGLAFTSFTVSMLSFYIIYKIVDVKRARNTSKFNLRFCIIAFFAIAILTVFGSFYTTQQKNNHLATPAPTPTAVWYTWTNKEGGFSVRTPPNWSEKDVYGLSTGSTELTNKEGGITVEWGTQFDSGCSHGYEKIQISEEQLSTCHSVNQKNNSELWGQILKIAGRKTFSIHAWANAPYKLNRNVILIILSTLKFSN